MMIRVSYGQAIVTDLSLVCLPLDSTIRCAMHTIDSNGKGIALVCDNGRHLLGVITDGDIRRVILAGWSLDKSVETVLAAKSKAALGKPFTALYGSDSAYLISFLNDHGIRQLPLVDEEGCVQDVVTVEDLVPGYGLPLQAVIMAGGFGTRLRPLTEHMPKPMLPIGNKPLLEHIVLQLKAAGIRRVHLSTHFGRDVIEDYFGDGTDLGVELNYLREGRPLGTAGALSMLDVKEEALLVINGDILTRVDFRAMLDFHREHRAIITVGVREYQFPSPFGILETSGVDVIGIAEKPIIKHLMNAGIYLLGPEACACVPNDQEYQMTDLISLALEKNLKVVSFPIREYWRDIGRMDDYEKAIEDFKQGLVE